MEGNRETWEKDLVDGCLKNDRLSQEKLYRRMFPVMLAYLKKRVKDEERSGNPQHRHASCF
ncbi:MAG: hypothetical protein R2784_09090 [Saprospiraceae bacterium]